MSKSVLRNPRARRMLDLLCIDGYEDETCHSNIKKSVTQNDEDDKPQSYNPKDEISNSQSIKKSVKQNDRYDETESYNLTDETSDCHSIKKGVNQNGRNDETESYNLTDETSDRPSIKKSVNKNDKTQSYNLRDVKKKYYDERDKENEDYSADNSSDYLPSPNHDVQTPSSISSFGGDSTHIEKLIKNNNCLWSPSEISNLSLVLNNNVNFVASPNAIYTCLSSNPGTSKMMKEPRVHHQSNRTLPLTPLLQEQQKDLADETLKPNEEENSLNWNEIVVYNEHNINPCKEIENSNIFTTVNSEANGSHIELGLVAENHILQCNELTSSSIQDCVQTENVLNNDQIETTSFETPEQKKHTRKRKSNMDEWIDKKNKTLKNLGKPYIGVRNKKKREEKSIGPVCKCVKKCGEKFSTEQRESIFQKFQQLGSHELHWQYIVRHTETKPIKRMTFNRKNNRVQTISYFFYFDDLSSVNVCKTFFLNTLKISEQTVYTALEKIKRDESLTDNRGTHKNRPHKMSASTRDSVIAHIKIFPTVESHYVRKDTNRLYLAEDLNISKMYRLYELWFPNQQFSLEHKASKRHYEFIFNTEFNYSFFKPKKDLCGVCSQFDQANEAAKIGLEAKYNDHLSRKNKVRELKEQEKILVDKNTTTIAIFDLEKVLNIPQSNVGIFHYKRKYPIYNFTVYDSLDKLGHCFVWHLSIAKRGATEIGSCLKKFIQQEAIKGKTSISFYSDGCAGQNKNRYIFALYLYAVRAYNMQNITHRFFETGHGQNEGDSMHSCIERAMKNKILYTPDQVYSVIMNAKVTGNNYKIHEMEQPHFYEIKSLISGKNWLKDTQGNKIKWTKVMEVKVSHLNPHILQFKYDFQEEYLELNTEFQIPKRRRGRPTNSTGTGTEAENFALRPAYSQKILISRLLHADLQSLCASSAIPHHYHDFYNSLTSCDTTTNLSDSDQAEEDD